MPTIHEQLLNSARLNDSKQITFYIKKDADIHTKDENGRTPLHIAAENNSLHAAQVLIEHGANLDAMMNDNGTPLMDAVALGHDGMVSLLLSAGARTDVVDNCEWSLLHWAASEDHPTTAALLLRHNPSLVHMSRWNGVTALHLARSSDMTKLLLDGATIETLFQHANLFPDDFEDKTGMSKPEFEALLQCFKLDTPKSSSNKERLFAILCVEKYNLNAKEIGQMLSYTNAKRDGIKFIEKATAALALARQQRSEVLAGKHVLSVDRAFIEQKTNDIFKQVPLGRHHRDSERAFSLSLKYYNIDQDINDHELHSMKWRTYIYLRKCILDYRVGKKEELEGIIHFLEFNSENKTWFTSRLIDKAVKIKGELWCSGAHEWLERCLIVDVLKRSAGMVEGVESETGIGCVAPNYDWLYCQAIIRSPTKFVLFKNHGYTIENGHCGAVRPKKDKKGFASKGSPGFHQLLEDAFYASTTIEGFLKLIRNIFKQELYSGKKRINESEHRKYLIDGSKTSKLTELSLFRRTKLLPEGYLKFKDLLSATIEYATDYGNNVQEDISDVASDTTEATSDSYASNVETDDDSDTTEATSDGYASNTETDDDSADLNGFFSKLSVTARL